MGDRLMAASGKECLIHFEPERCTQCHGCETACKSWRGLGPGVQYRRVFNLWRGAYPNVKCTSLSLACLHCVQPACLEACPVEAITKQAEEGLVSVDDALCIGCRSCAEVCPFGVPQFDHTETMRKCDLCRGQNLAGAAPPCVDTCPGKALSLVAVKPAEKLIREERIAQKLKAGEA
jgi:anaerobic dimethyl sulfoxide reductase subunit B (iron-sulfur subunit)